ncbi:MAG: hypothetical protein AB7N76_09010 [Planctomycetota bacterium]
MSAIDPGASEDWRPFSGRASSEQSRARRSRSRAEPTGDVHPVSRGSSSLAAPTSGYPTSGYPSSGNRSSGCRAAALEASALELDALAPGEALDLGLGLAGCLAVWFFLALATMLLALDWDLEAAAATLLSLGLAADVLTRWRPRARLSPR